MGVKNGTNGTYATNGTNGLRPLQKKKIEKLSFVSLDLLVLLVLLVPSLLLAGTENDSQTTKKLSNKVISALCLPSKCSFTPSKLRFFGLRKP